MTRVEVVFSDLTRRLFKGRFCNMVMAALRDRLAGTDLATKYPKIRFMLSIKSPRDSISIRAIIYDNEDEFVTNDSLVIRDTPVAHRWLSETREFL